MEDGNVYVYDFSELREEVKNVETQRSELVSVQSEQASLQSEQLEAVQTQISDILSFQSEQASEMVSVIGDTVQYTSLIKQHTEIEVILLFAVVAFCGFLSGLLITNLIRK